MIYEIAKKMDKDYDWVDSRSFLEDLGFVIQGEADGVYKVKLPQGWKVEAMNFYPATACSKRATFEDGSLEVTTFCGEQGAVLSFLYGNRERSTLTFRNAFARE